MTFKIKSILLAICLLLLGTTVLRSAVGVTASATPSGELMGLLPRSDAVALVDVKRLMAEAIPMALTADPARLGDLNRHLDKFKAKTGLDPRKWDQLAVGGRGTNPQSIEGSDVVVVARGNIDTAAIAAAGTLAPNGRYEDGPVIYLIKYEDEDTKDVNVKPFAVAIIDQSTLVIGQLALVKETVEGRNGGPRNADLIALVNHSPSACISFGANLPPHLTNGMKLPSDDLAKTIDSIRQVYGSMNLSSSALDLFAAAKTHSGDEAQTLNATLESLKDLASMLISQLGADRAKVAQSTLDNIKIEKTGDEVQLKATIPQTDLTTLIQSFQKKKS